MGLENELFQNVSSWVIMKHLIFDRRNTPCILSRATLVCSNLELLFSRAFIGNVKNIWYSSSLELNGNLEMSKFHQEQMS